MWTPTCVRGMKPAAGGLNQSSSLSDVEVCVLAGGASSRMGRDKARIRWGGRSFLSRLKLAAAEAGLPCRVIVRDRVPRCGPLGGIATGLMTSKYAKVLFLACDMPLVDRDILRSIAGRSCPQGTWRFTWHEERVGFPLLMPVSQLPQLLDLMRGGVRSLKELARRTKAARILHRKVWRHRLANINTPKDLEKLRIFHEERSR